MSGSKWFPAAFPAAHHRSGQPWSWSAVFQAVPFGRRAPLAWAAGWARRLGLVLQLKVQLVFLRPFRLLTTAPPGFQPTKSLVPFLVERRLLQFPAARQQLQLQELPRLVRRIQPRYLNKGCSWHFGRGYCDGGCKGFGCRDPQPGLTSCARLPEDGSVVLAASICDSNTPCL